MCCYISAAKSVEVVFIAPPYVVEDRLLNVHAVPKDRIISVSGLEYKQIRSCPELVT
jgi:hypothetical protein